MGHQTPHDLCGDGHSLAQRACTPALVASKGVQLSPEFMDAAAGQPDKDPCRTARQALWSPTSRARYANATAGFST